MRFIGFEFPMPAIRRSALLGAGLAAGGCIGLAPAMAQIENSATATGVHDGQAVESPATSVTVETEPATARLEASATGTLDVSGGASADAVDAGDSVSYAVTVTNSGNVVATGVQPAASVSAGGSPGTGELGVFEPQSADIPPGASQTFTVSYTLATEDILRAAGQQAGLSAAVSAAGTGPSGGVSAESQAAVTVAAAPQLAIVKEAALGKAEGNSGAKAEPGDTITYLYTVANTGNVAIRDVGVTDVHGGVTLLSAEAGGTGGGPWDETEIRADPLGLNSDAGGTDGTWDLLGAGGVVTFTYVHTVTQAEFEAR